MKLHATSTPIVFQSTRGPEGPRDSDFAGTGDS
jgi:hypothetical protein